MPKVGEIYRDKPYEGYKLIVTKVTKHNVYYRWIEHPGGLEDESFNEPLNWWEDDLDNWELDKQYILKQILDKTEELV